MDYEFFQILESDTGIDSTESYPFNWDTYCTLTNLYHSSSISLVHQAISCLEGSIVPSQGWHKLLQQLKDWNKQEASFQVLKDEGYKIKRDLEFVPRWFFEFIKENI